MREVNNNPSNLDVRDIAQYILDTPGYNSYDDLEKRRMLNKLGPAVLPATVEYPEDPEAA